MRILHTAATYWPSADGVSLVVQKLSEGLVERGHEVTVATAGRVRRCDERNGVRIERFAVSGNAVLGIEGDAPAYGEFVASFECDVMLNYAAQIWTTDLVLPLLSQLDCRKVIVPCGYSELGSPAYAAYFAELPGYLDQYDAAIYLSGDYQDAAFAAASRITNGVVIGNAADEGEFGHLEGGFREALHVRESLMLLCVANYGDLKGQSAVVEAFVRSGIRDAALVFIGSEMNRYATGVMRTPRGAARSLRRKFNIAWHEWVLSPLGCGDHLRFSPRPGISIHIIAGLERSQIVKAYVDADMFVFGSLVECAPLVIYEAMASGTPFVSTRVGNVAELPGGLIAEAPDQLPALMARLAASRAERQRLGRAGREAWRAESTWSRVLDRYEDLYRALLDLERAS